MIYFLCSYRKVCMWIILSTIILRFPLLSAQNRSFGTLPLIQNGKLIVKQEGNLNHTAEFSRLIHIYNNLVSARGDMRYKVPTLLLKDVEGFVAFIDYSSNEIIFEKKAYDVCDKYGDDAFAFLLGHELTHYYEKHAWRSSFTRENSDLEIGKELRGIDDQIVNETEADYLGGLLCYTAGYGLFDNGADVISDLYKAYGLEELIPGYPSLTDRIELSKRSAEKLKSLVDVFDMANYLLVIGRYEEAFSYFDYILNYYQSRELYNNVGVAAVLSAMELFDESELTFKYVTTLDTEFNGSKSIGDSNEKKIQLLQQAILHFNASITLDPEYAPAYLNKANAYALLQDWEKATFYLLQEALPAAQKSPQKFAKTLSDIIVLEGIILAKTNKIEEAKSKFEEAIKLENEIAKYNLAVLNKSANSTLEESTSTIKFEEISGTSLNDFYDELIVDDKKVIQLDDQITFFQQNPVHGNCRIFLSKHNDKKSYTTFMFTADAYDGLTGKNIKLGDSLKTLESKYGKPKNILETTIGQYWHYDQIVFLIEKNIVKKWFNYDTRILNF